MTKNTFSNVVATAPGYSNNLKKAVAWLVDEKNFPKVLELTKENETFDFPDYYGLPEKIASNLMSDEVDALQDWTNIVYYPFLLKYKKLGSAALSVKSVKPVKKTENNEEYHVFYGKKLDRNNSFKILHSLYLANIFMKEKKSEGLVTEMFKVSVKKKFEKIEVAV